MVKSSFKFSDRLEILRLPNSKSIVRYRNYTYSQAPGKGNLVCSRKRRGKCNAKLKLNDAGQLVSADTNHNHEPPVFHKTSFGEYIKLNWSRLWKVLYTPRRERATSFIYCATSSNVMKGRIVTTICTT